MATANKTSVKKTSPVKKAAVKRPAAAKKTSAKVAPKMRSFHVSPDVPAFGTFKITRQTVYWIIIISFIIFMQLSILSLEVETSNYIENQLSALDNQ